MRAFKKATHLDALPFLLLAVVKEGTDMEAGCGGWDGCGGWMWRPDVEVAEVMEAAGATSTLSKHLNIKGNFKYVEVVEVVEVFFKPFFSPARA